MGVVAVTEEFTSPVAAKRLFTALILDADNLFPKLFPEHVKSVETIEGNGGPGTIKKITLAEGKYVKQRIDALDKDGLAHSYTTIEGVALLDKFEAIGHEIKLEATADGGCKGKNVNKYYLKPGAAEVKEEEVKEGKEKAAAVFKVVEAYLVANPQAYA